MHAGLDVYRSSAQDDTDGTHALARHQIELAGESGRHISLNTGIRKKDCRWNTNLYPFKPEKEFGCKEQLRAHLVTLQVNDVFANYPSFNRKSRSRVTSRRLKYKRGGLQHPRNCQNIKLGLGDVEAHRHGLSVANKDTSV